MYRWHPDEAINDEGYESVYNLLRITPAADSADMEIVVQLVSGGQAGGEPYVDVSGRVCNSRNYSGEPDCDSYAIEFKPWEQWLGMEIDPVAFELFSETEILAHCLYEMTFVGFDEDEIQKRYQEINSLADEIKALAAREKEEKLIPWEKIKRELGL